jgi:hypothetical protein
MGKLPAGRAELLLRALGVTIATRLREQLAMNTLHKDEPCLEFGIEAVFKHSGPRATFCKHVKH